MGPKFSLAHLTVLGTTPLELIEIAAGAGYDYVSIRTTPVAPDEHVIPLAGDPAMVRKVVQRLADTGVQVLDVELARLRPDDEPDQYLAVFEAAAAVGARHVIGQLPDPDRTRATDRFGRLCDLALDFGVSVELEFPSWTETGDLAAAAAVPRGRRPDQRRDPDRHPPLLPVDSSLDELTSLPAAGSASSSCATPRRRHRRRWRPSSTPRAALAPRLRRPPPDRAARSAARRALLARGPQRRAPSRAGTASYARLVLAAAREVVADHGQPVMTR